MDHKTTSAFAIRLIACFIAFTSFVNDISAQWRELGGIKSLTANSDIWSVCADSSGNVYAAGEFTNSSGNFYVAKWNGSNWSELGGTNALGADSLITTVYCDAAGNVYAAGNFSNSSGKYYVAKYNGSTWSELGGTNALAANGQIYTISSDAAGNIYAAGGFTNGSGYNYVAKYNGSTWSELGGTNALAVYGNINSVCCDPSGNVYAAGDFWNNSNNNYYVAKYNGSTWSELGGNNALAANGVINGICSDPAGNIYAVGEFTNGNIYNWCYVAKYNGSTWGQVGGSTGFDLPCSILNSVCSDPHGNIYAAGADYPNSDYFVASWADSTWSMLGNNNYFTGNTTIWSVCSDRAGNIYAPLYFEVNNNNTYNYFVGKWNGNTWIALGGSDELNGNGPIEAVCADTMGNLYSGGNFTNNFDGFNSEYVAKWDGSIWSEAGGINTVGPNFIITAMCYNKGYTYAGGWFTDDSNKCYVAKWEGNTWSELGGLDGLAANYYIQTICSDTSGNIYAAGGFTNSSGKYYVAKFNGSTWSELGGINALAANESIKSICSDPAGNIYAGGLFTTTSYNSLTYVAKWDGTSWSALEGSDSLLATTGWINSVCSDSSGNIYAAGTFTNDSSRRYVAKWNGSTWSELGGTNALAANQVIYSLSADRSGNIYAAGNFTNASGYRYVAQWNGVAWSELGGPNALAADSIIYSVGTDRLGNVYAAGSFTDANGNMYVAKYGNGTYTYLADTICQGYSVSVAGQIYSTTGTYTISLTGYLGGDSIIALHLTVIPYSFTNIFDTICRGSSYSFGGQNLSAAGTYYDTLTSVHGCDSIVTLYLGYRSDSIRAQFTLQSSSTPHLWYVLNQCTGTPPISYTWTWGDGSALSIGDTPSHTYDTAGYYTICVSIVDSFECSASYCDSSIYLFKDQSAQMVYVDVVNQIPSGIIETQSLASLQIYPNPASNTVTISSGSNFQSIRIMDQTGEIVRSAGDLHSTQYTLSVAGLAEGIYYVQVIGSDDAAVRKLVVE